MTPEEAKELFSAAYDGELDEAQQRAFDAALASDPALGQQYTQFSDTLAAAAAAADSSSAQAADEGPDLLAGVQQRLRTRSRGRFYADRFAERGGKGLLSPFALALIMAALCALAWFALSYLQGIELSR